MLFIVAIVVVWPSMAFSRAVEIKGPVHRATWPPGLEDLANRANRVLGYNVNMNDVFFYGGDLAALNEFLSKYALLKKVDKLEVVLHPGSTKAQFRGDGVPANWSMRVEMPWSNQRAAGRKEETQVDVWLGALGPLTHLKVPLNVAVRSGGEIEDYVSEHAAKQRAEKGKQE
jgi:hypothetical protein